MKTAPNWSRHLWWILSLASLISLASWILHSTELLNEWLSLTISIALIAFLIRFRFPLGGVNINLVHAVSLTLGIALNPGTAGIALTLGFVFGELIYRAYQRLPNKQRGQEWLELKIQSLEYSRQALSLFGGLALYQILGGTSLQHTKSLPDPIPAIGLALGFTILFLTLHWLTRLLLESRRSTRRETVTLILVAILPTAFAILSAASLVAFGPIAILVFGGVFAIIAPILRNLSQAERDLQRRLQELSTISQVSQAMRTTLDLDSLLTTIYLQVAHLLEVDNFYIALISPDRKRISYPIAIKNGRRQEWPDRILADRLTENVIVTTTSILIPEEAPEVLRDMGFPELDNAPYSWLGVPLLNPERTIGCIGVFHTEENKRITEKDKDVLTTLAGHASVAIENALLYDQTRKRAQALALLNEIASSIGSTLDPERALELVNQSMIRVGGGQKAAIYLLDQEHRKLLLARASNLSDQFMQNSKTISLDDSERASATISNKLVLIRDIGRSNYPDKLKELFLEETIQALAEFPLTTPKGTIGQLAVYFTQPQQFEHDQIEMMETFASQAAIAVSNARVYAETDLALRRKVAQLSTIEEIGREMVTTLNLDELFTIILDHALRLTNSEIGYLTVYEKEAEGLRVAAQRNCAPHSKAGEVGRISPIDEGIVGQAFQTASPQLIHDLAQDIHHVDWSGAGARSILCVPVTRKGKSMGVITIESIYPDAFWAEQEQFLSQLAAQAAIALSNAWLYQELEDHLREQALLFQAGKEIAMTLETDAVAHAVVDNMAIALSVDGANLYRWDELQGSLNRVAAIEEGHPKKVHAHDSIYGTLAPSLIRCVEAGLPVQWTLENSPSRSDYRYLVEELQADTLLAIPLTIGAETLGLIEVISKNQRIFKERELRTARTIASQAAVALKNTDLFRQIQQNHESLVAVLNSTEEGILMADPEGRIVIANHQLEGLTGLKMAAMIGHDLSNEEVTIAPQLGFSDDELARRLKALQQNQSLDNRTASFEIQSPIRRSLERAEALVHDAAGNLIGWLIVLRDVSKEKELNEARKHITEMIVHDLRSPLTAILSSLRILDGILAAEEEAPMLKQALSIAQRSCNQMLGLVNSLLDIAKLESGELPIAKGDLSLQELCSDLIKDFIPAANESGIILTFKMNEAIPQFYGDEEKIRRIISNLVDNALKFTPPGGQVTVELNSSENAILLAVLDTGPGVPIEYREKIFDRFFQMPDSVGRGLGTGLGLAFAKLAVEAHGGTIWVEGNPDGGSVFRIHFPIMR